MARIRTANGLTVGYTDTDSGTGTATPIVFLHGVGSDRSVWRPQMESFSKERRAVAFDYPGYGDSETAPEGTSRDDYATTILAAMTELGIQEAHVCGLSLGGVVAIAMHHAWPRRIKSLILADTFADLPDGKGFYERGVAASADLRAMAENRVDVLLAQPADPAVRAEVIETMARIDPEAYRIGARAVWLAQQCDRAQAIRVPTLVLCGAEDRITPPALSNTLAKLIVGAQCELIEGAGHISNLERPDEFNLLVGAFIRGVDLRA
jgi:3-oxoadipate enol-lactonase